jgi:DNA polymerase-3 subunit delta'
MTNFTPTIHPWNHEVWQNLTLEPERSNHALLFNGDAGLGKRDLALALAHLVITGSHNQSESLFNGGSHPDLHVLMPESAVEDNLLGAFAKRYLEQHSGKPKKTISIDQVRRLSQSLDTHPHISTHRLILIFHAETMNRNASNALLKSLEEPPANTLFIIVTDELSKLVKTIRSRCSLVNFRQPDPASAKAWLELDGTLPPSDIDTYLSMSNNQPLEAIRLFKDDYLGALKTVFTDVNNLWMCRAEVTQVAKNWQTLGSSKSVDILQKLATDLLRSSLSESPESVFFPVQKSWVSSVSAKLSRAKIVLLHDELNYAKRMLATTVDELLVLETLSNNFSKLPS